MVQARPAAFEDLAALARRGALRAVLEAVDTPQVPRKAEALGRERAVSLGGELEEEGERELAPWLVEVDEATLGWIRDELSGIESWGILLESERSVEELGRHFRHWVVVEDPRGDEVYFRFHDALVLGTFLAYAPNDDIRRLFGPVRAFYALPPPSGAEGPVPATYPRPAGATAPGADRPRIGSRLARAFGEKRFETFVEALAQRVHDLYPEKTDGRPDRELREFLRRLCDRSRKYGLTSDPAVTEFVEHSLDWGEGFEESPAQAAVRATLRDRSLSPEVKLTRIREALHAYEGDDPFAIDELELAVPARPPLLLAEP